MNRPSDIPREIFISYTTEDRGIADNLCAELESAGLTCWIAPRNIEPGSNWTASIMRAIAECRVMVLVFSAKSNESPHVVREILHAVEKGRLIFPIRIENVLPTGGLEYCLVGVQWFDAAALPLSSHVASLVAQMRLLLQRSGEVLAALHPQVGAEATGVTGSGPPRDIYFQCDGCGQHLVTDATAAGQSIPCPHCGNILTVSEAIDAPSGPPQPAAGETAPTVSDAQLLAPEAVAKIEKSLTAIIGPLGPRIVRKAMARTRSLAALSSELLAAIPTAHEQEAFLRSCGDLLPTGAPEVTAGAPPQPARGPSGSGAPAAAALDPAVIAELKTTLATFVGPLAKVLVNRALAKSGSVSELLDLLAAELDSPKDRERFLHAAQAMGRPDRQGT